MRLELELSPDGGAAVLRPAGRGGKPSQAKDGVGIVPNKAGAVAIEEMNQRVAKAFRAGKL